MEKLISVIVPVYKVEQYLEKCIDSIINQTYKNLEIILVDDGSPDNCGKICDDYAEKDSRIKVVHKENGGLSDARNAGYEFVNGEYISFIDSDDYIATDFYEILVNTMVKENSDIVECGVVKFCENEDIKTENKNPVVRSFDTVEALESLVEEKDFHQHVWNKLYKTELVMDVKFEKGKLNEDEFWTYQIFGKAKKVSRISVGLYYYLQRGGSIMGNSYNLRRLDALEALSQRQKYLDEFYPQVSSVAKIRFFGSCIFACQSAMKFLKGKEKKQAKKIILKYAKESKLGKAEKDKLNDNIRGWILFADKAFMLCCKIRSITGVGF